ncbi:MAG: helix-turn-helix transcriptional regulator, partial [Planctomycetaceae bacterium]|nr:helix-turn-helix transcriptional regulator [Planctomycetaceae bacterium]
MKNSVEFTACPCAGATLDKLLQPAVLAVLAEESLHGYELTKRIGEIQGFLDAVPDMSGIYRTLKTMEERGLVQSDWNVCKGERAKRIYSVTEKGKLCLEHWQETLRQHGQAV